MATLVIKLGGSLLTEAASILRLIQAVVAESLAWQQVVVVVSAMGGATDSLRRAIDLAGENNGLRMRPIIHFIYEKHLNLINELFSEAPTRQRLIEYMQGQLSEVLIMCNAVMQNQPPGMATARQYDAVMAAGEQIMTEIVTALLRREIPTVRVPAEAVIATDGTHLNATPYPEQIAQNVKNEILPLLEQKLMVVMAGFIGATNKGVLTTLGRGGSDYTATLLADALAAKEVWICSQVQGIMSADPLVVPHARVIKSLTYDEMLELTYFGMRILHPEAITPLMRANIRLRVLNPLSDQEGTLIQKMETDPTPVLKVITTADGVYVAGPTSFTNTAEFAKAVHAKDPRARLAIAMETGKQALAVFVVPTSEGPDAAQMLAKNLADQLDVAHVTLQAVKVIAIIGANTAPDLEKYKITPLAYASGVGKRYLLAVYPSEFRDVVRKLYNPEILR
jgi:aspartate kinase